jgi:hypothetical protein
MYGENTMTWEVMEKIVRFKGKIAYADIVIQRKDDSSPFIYAIVDEARDKAMVLHAMCDSIEEAKTMAIGSLQAYEALTHNLEQNNLFVIEDHVLMVGIRTEYGDKYEPIAGSGSIESQITEIINSATRLLNKYLLQTKKNQNDN